ncbi:Osmotically-inducible protein Y precursor [Gimesia panareensis]|uniref:Osmotically-inducible protein Y n=1 Tax=Gimesia panareensis TaxID=2527978 RepID=A0A518FK85_9PLAN|nr:BON domain-containing protein [Gimesia panareensis]QDV16747.1 Osmotically-inducible protein Y precursor [Gimesia panareensis]
MKQRIEFVQHALCFHQSKPRRGIFPVALVLSLCLVGSTSVSAGEKSPPKQETASQPKTSDVDLKALTDELIMLAIDDELRRSEAVDGHRIDVDVAQGIVTLSGHVNNYLAKEIAVGLAERVRGTVSVIDEMVVNVEPSEDKVLIKDIQNALKADPGTQHLSIKVAAERGEVTLTGEVPTTGEKTLAGEVAMGVKGLTELENQLKVNHKQQLSDDDMQHEISELIKYSVLLDDSELEVAVKDRTAIITGHVARAFQKSHADMLAYLGGAKEVDSRGVLVHWKHTNPMLRTKRYEQATDADIKQAVERTFKYDPRLLSYDPKVTVKDGVVTLTGDVGNQAAQRAADKDARHTIGVRRVKNNLSVRWEDKPPTDEQIADFTRAAIARDPYLERHNLIVECRNAHVSLYGLVDTQFEKYHADWIASRQKGVVHINDYLAVRKKWKPKSDAAIEADLKEKLAYDFIGPDNQVSATVKNGVAILEGTVDSWLMWQRALDLAIAAGAREPHNLIEVRYGLPSGPHYYGPHMYVPR